MLVNYEYIYIVSVKYIIFHIDNKNRTCMVYNHSVLSGACLPYSSTSIFKSKTKKK